MYLLNKKRLSQCFFLFSILFLLLVIRLYLIQLISGENYTLQAIKRETLTVELEDFPRGQILDRNLHPLTQGYQSNRIIVFPQAVFHPQAVAYKLAKILKRDKNQILHQLQDPCIIPYKISPEQVEAVKKLKCPGIIIAPVKFRYGPEPLAVHIVGHLGRSKNGDWVGKTGLEKYYEKELRSIYPENYARLFVDARGQWLKGLGPEISIHSVSGKRKDLVTTIDTDIQKVIERIMDKNIQDGAVVVMDVSSGDILAMASRPKYNPHPQELGHYLKVPGVFIDQCTSLFPPGSLFKIVVAAAALAEGAVTLDTVFKCLGEKDKPVRCWYGPGHGKVTFSYAFAQSCNPIFAKIALGLGPEKIILYARKFGLEDQQLIGYPIPYDNRQDLKLIAAPYNLVNSSLGQGPVLTTPVQITAMINTIVNDGVYKKPRLVKELGTPDGKIAYSFPSSKDYQAIPFTVAIQLKQMLELVTKEGIGKRAYLPGIGSAGKTGSAQTGNKNKIIAWFSGYAPLDNPRFVVTVLVNGGVSGSQTAAPIFSKIMSEILQLT